MLDKLIIGGLIGLCVIAVFTPFDLFKYIL